jgi:2-polyprenyl-3-methyl-5-hydroxy-6-metoxy-1,4-benzoquinol methylase
MEKAKKTSPAYWDNIWQNSNTAKGIDPHDNKISNFINRQFHLFFYELLKNYFTDLPLDKLKLLEVGCASSAWLAYFTKNYDMEVCGIDYSEKGCELAKKILKNSGVNGKIVQEDLFNPSSELLHNFDIVFSFGLVEHFNPISYAISNCSKFLKNNGIMITIIPNLKGIYGLIQKKIDIDIYDAHKPADLMEFIQEHKKADLEIIKSQYIIFLNLGMLNIEKIKKNSPLLWKILKTIRGTADIFFWYAEKKIPDIFVPNKTFSPYIICASKLKT